MRRKWISRRAVLLHLTVLVIVPSFALLCWWQTRRALSGNDLSWAYVFEWPFFAGYAVFVWWKLLHEDPAIQAPSSGPAGDAPVEAPDDGPDEDEDLAAYNAYLAELDASGRRKHW